MLDTQSLIPISSAIYCKFFLVNSASHLESQHPCSSFPEIPSPLRYPSLRHDSSFFSQSSFRKTCLQFATDWGFGAKSVKDETPKSAWLVSKMGRLTGGVQYELEFACSRLLAISS